MMNNSNNCDFYFINFERTNNAFTSSITFFRSVKIIRNPYFKVCVYFDEAFFLKR